MTGFAGVPRQRWPLYALVASLLLNGFLIGMMVTDWLKPPRRFTGERYATFELRRFDDRLPQDAVEQIAEELAPLSPALDEEIAELRARRAEIIAMAAEPEPDRAAIDERLAALRAHASAMQEMVQRATYDSLLRLPPETRGQMAEAAPE
jgi:hypothetical protein